MKRSAKATTRKASPGAPRSRPTFLGMPGSMRWPGWAAIGTNLWDPRPSARMFPPKVWGYGWSFNFAYPTIRSKPLPARIVAFVLGLIAIVAVTWLLIALATLIYYLLVPDENGVRILFR